MPKMLISAGERTTERARASDSLQISKKYTWQKKKKNLLLLLIYHSVLREASAATDGFYPLKLQANEVYNAILLRICLAH